MIRSSALHASCRSVRGFSFSTLRKYRPHAVKPIAEKVIPLLEKKRLQMIVGHMFALADAAKGHVLMESRKSTGKIILIPPGSELEKLLQA